MATPLRGDLIRGADFRPEERSVERRGVRAIVRHGVGAQRALGHGDHDSCVGRFFSAPCMRGGDADRDTAVCLSLSKKSKDEETC